MEEPGGRSASASQPTRVSNVPRPSQQATVASDVATPGEQPTVASTDTPPDQQPTYASDGTPAPASPPWYTAEGLGALADERPDVAVGASFVGGFLLAMILRRLAH